MKSKSILILKDELDLSQNEVNNINNFTKNIREINSNFSYDNFLFTLYGEFTQENNLSYNAKYVKNTISDKASYFCEYCNPSILSERKIPCTHTNALIMNFLNKNIDKKYEYKIDFILKKNDDEKLDYFYGIKFDITDSLSVLINNDKWINKLINSIDEEEFKSNNNISTLELLKIKEFISFNEKTLDFLLANMLFFKYIDVNNNIINEKKVQLLSNDKIPKIEFTSSLNKYVLSNWNKCNRSRIFNFFDKQFLIMEYDDHIAIKEFSKNIYEKTSQFLNYINSSSKNMIKVFTFFIDNNLEEYIENKSIIPSIDLFHESIINNWKYRIDIFDKNNNDDECLCVKFNFNINDNNYPVDFLDNSKWILSLDPTLYYDLSEIKHISTYDKGEFLIKEKENIELLENFIKKISRNKKIDLFIESKYVASTNKKSINFNVTFKNSMCKLEFNSSDLTNDEILELLSKYKDNKNLIKLKNDKVINMVNFDIKSLQNKLEEIGLVIEDVIDNNSYINNEMTFFLNSKLNNKEILQYINKFNDYQNKLSISNKLLNILKPHQIDGSNWVIKMLENNFGCLIADDMGVGKTLQAITVLDTFHKENKNKKSIIICPLSLVYNWKKEIEEYSENLLPIEVIGNKKQREEIIKSEKHNIFIISYSSLTKDIELLKNEDYLITILDESQFIKNNNSLNYKSVKQIKSTYKIALTGTPIENNLLELWSIFNFITPGLLGNKKNFVKKFSSNNRNSINLLREIIKPFYIRREKKDVLNDLPEKKINIVSTKFNSDEKEHYESIRKETISYIMNNESSLNTFQKNSFMFKKLTEMRMFCCKGNGRDKCSKLTLCLDLIDEILNNDETNKILIFSQFTTVLDYISKQLINKNIKFEILTGSNNVKERQDKIKNYTENSEIKIFLISLKAGGVGLNITAANNVIHYDPWWNVAVENQATDRSYRLGQKRDVNVYKLIVEDTIEEKIISLQNEKTNLFNDIISDKNENKIDIDLFKKIISFPSM